MYALKSFIIKYLNPQVLPGLRMSRTAHANMVSGRIHRQAEKSVYIKKCCNSTLWAGLFIPGMNAHKKACVCVSSEFSKMTKMFVILELFELRDIYASFALLQFFAIQAWLFLLFDTLS